MGTAARSFTAAAVLFDNDGVLVDSRAAGNVAWSTWSHRRGLDATAVLAGVHGRRSQETVALFVPADEVDAATVQIEQLELELAPGTLAIPGAAQLVARIPEQARALVTSGSRALAAARLTGAGIPVPAVIVAAEDVSAGKPAPEPYLRAAHLLGVPPGQCLVLEDSDHGIQAARAAGAGTVIGVGATALGQGCDGVVPDLTGVCWTGGGLRLQDVIEDRRL